LEAVHATAHGEIVAIRRFLAKYGPEKLKQIFRLLAACWQMRLSRFSGDATIAKRRNDWPRDRFVFGMPNLAHIRRI
jgi:hypothetical protein